MEKAPSTLWTPGLCRQRVQIPISLISSFPQTEHLFSKEKSYSLGRHFLHKGSRKVLFEQHRHLSPPSSSESKCWTSMIKPKRKAKRELVKSGIVLILFTYIYCDFFCVFGNVTRKKLKISAFFLIYRPLSCFFQRASKSKACRGVMSSGSELRISSRTSSSSEKSPGIERDLSRTFSSEL